MTRLFRVLLPAALLGALGMAGSAVVAAPILQVGSAVAMVGSSFSVAVSVTDAVDLTAWQFDLSYDPQRFRADAVTEGAMFPGFGTSLFSPGVIDPLAGLVSLVAGAFTDFGPSPSGSGVLAQISFTALQRGASELALSNVFLNLSADGFAAVDGRLQAVPEPGALLLAALALAALAATRRPSGAKPPA